MPEPDGAARIAAAFESARAEGRAALMPYMMGGFPDPAGSLAIARAYVEGGADLIELGVPFSDPLADGPVIHAAATAALAAGVTLADVLETCEAVSAEVPVVLMTYVNTINAVGPAAFAERLVASGAAGAIVPDAPMEEAEEIRDALGAVGLALVPLVAPTTPPARRARICAQARGFVYVVSVAGVTGERGEIPPGLAELVAAVQEEATVPAAVGFGIGSPQQAAAVGEIADGVIIGSRLVRAVADRKGDGDSADSVRAFLQEAREAMS